MLIQIGRFKNVITLLLVLLLSACQTVPSPDVDPNLEVFDAANFTQQYQQRLEGNSWSLKGAFGFTNDVESVQGKVFWEQATDNTQIKLLGPLGAGSVKLSLQPNSASMQKGRKTYTANNADELMLKVLGWQMPFESLSYWLYGLAAPDQKAWYRSGEKGEVVELQQSGWVIRFKQYRQVDGFSLFMPRKIFASHEKTGTNVRLVVTKISR